MLEKKPKVKRGRPALTEVKVKKYKEVLYKGWNPIMAKTEKLRQPLKKEEIRALIANLGITVCPKRLTEDTRKCLLCGLPGDQEADGPGR